MTATDTTPAHLQDRARHTASVTAISAVSRPARQFHASTGRWLQISYVIVDILLVSIGGVAAVALRLGFLPKLTVFLNYITKAGWPGVDQSMNFYLAFLMLYVALIVVCCQNQHLYQRVMSSGSLFDESFSVLKAVGVATLLLGAFIYVSGVKSVPRSVVGLSAIFNVATLIGWRALRAYFVRRRVRNGIGTRNVLIIGAGRVGKSLASYFQHNPHLGYVVKGFLDQRANGDSSTLGSIGDLRSVAQAHFADEIFVTIPQHRTLVKQVILEAQKSKLGVSVIPELFDGLGRRAPIKYIGDLPVMELHREPIPELKLFVKRLLDLSFSVIAIVISAPFLLALAIAIKLDSRGPVLYCASRVGKRGRLFTCFKLRTMSFDADLRKEQLRHLNERKGPFFKIAADPRITATGRWLRKYSLDELPQLLNVIRGEMSLVGPRPHPVDDCKNYNVEHLRRLDVCPGLTGLWQVTARRDPSFEKSVALDLEYIENWSFWLDLEILLKTIPEIIRASGI
jgi:exopolysaccharide biosynthesis polyprenyl glycosylphosphotransferase